jgi:hypothetical protein
MTNFSRKKIRGFDRKIKQLDSWRNFIVSYPFDKMKSSGEIFRVHLHPFTWHGNQNPNIKFHTYFYIACLDILKNLKDNETLRKKEMTVQLWLFYPRTVKSLIIVAPKELFVKRNDQINARPTEIKPPKIIGKHFVNYTLKLGEDNVFKSNKPQSENPEWQTIKLGEIWTIE